MRIIQSYWACNKIDLLHNQPSWYAPEYNLMSWALSCLQLKKYYKKVFLYADSITSKILIDDLKLPYTDIYCTLDSLNSYNSELWALPKINVYSQQDKPFLHVDGDVFIWEKFDKKLMSSNLIAQNLESATNYYEEIMRSLEDNLSYFPNEMVLERKSGNPILAYNAGIFGGTDTTFFKEYSKKAFDFVNKNCDSLSKINVGNFNIFFEQYLFYCLAKKQKKNVSVLITDVIGDNEYKGFGDFSEVPYNKKYLHLLGSYKKSDLVCTQLANYLRQEYPEYYYRIISLYKENGYALSKDYYHFLSDHSEDSLVNRQNLLKVDYLDGSLSVKENKGRHLPAVISKVELEGISKDASLDLSLFYDSLYSIKKTKFRSISKDFLYGRDLNVFKSYVHLFSEPAKVYDKNIIVGEHSYQITSKFNWSNIDVKPFPITDLSNSPSIVYTIVIPECSQKGYSLYNIDLLDIEILNYLKKKRTIGELLDNCKRLFDSDDLKSSKDEYEKLILGRVKMNIYRKLLKVVF